MTKHPSGKGAKMLLYLGSESSKEYNAMVAAIAHRNQIKKLEREIARLEKLKKVGGGKKQNKTQPTYTETTIILQLQTQLNQVMKALEELTVQQGEFMAKIRRD